MKREELKPIYDNAKSFYKKAFVEKCNDKIKLYSYDTHVATIYLTESGRYYSLNKDVREDLLFSQTTLRHIKEFLNQFMSALDVQYSKLISKGFTKKSIKECSSADSVLYSQFDEETKEG